jgi:diguanylate cyclase (GGDEF)-like protein
MLLVRWNFWIVAASVLIATLASYVALDLARRVKDAQDDGTALAWKTGGSVAMGTGIWSMHFVGMLAFKLPIELAYDYWTTLLSWVAAVTVSGVALSIAARPRLALSHLILGAALMGAGISAMHYIGMAALQLSPGIVWNYWLVAASVLIAVSASAAALLILFWLRRQVTGHALSWQLTAASVMGLAIAGMHYTGMAAANFDPSSVCLALGELGGAHLVQIVAIGTAVLLTLTLLTSALDVHLRAQSKVLAESLQTATEELQRIARTDTLTGLPNRLVFEDRLQHAAARAQRQGNEFAVLVVNLDGFKPINDSFGHVVGDRLLREVATRLHQLCRSCDTVARVGGDEFLVLLEGDTITPVQTLLVADRIIEAVSEPCDLLERELQLSCSVGIAMYPTHANPDRLVSCADAAMHTAKRAGGATAVLYQEHMDVHTREQMDLLRDLRVALDAGQLLLHYQPKITADGLRITGAEALLRWEHPQRGMISPGVFIPLAERFGLIVALGGWVIDEVCRQISAWRDQGLRMKVALNLSMHQLLQDSLIERIEQALAQHGVDAALLTFEITESVAMDDVQVTLRAFERLRALGVQLSIDDFGTGYSSLSYLRQMPAQQLKIDRSFVSDLESSADARAIVDAVVRLGHALGLKIVAEGVETQGQCDILIGLGCDELQGFLFARPMPAAMLSRWATSRDRPLEFTNSVYSSDALSELP